MMKLIRDYFEFRKLTMPVRDDFELDIIPDVGLSGFSLKRLEELKNYCVDHPEYHIMSILPFAIYVNSVSPAACYYCLAKGDPDAGLWHTDAMSQALFEITELRKFNQS